MRTSGFRARCSSRRIGSLAHRTYTMTHASSLLHDHFSHSTSRTLALLLASGLVLAGCGSSATPPDQASTGSGATGGSNAGGSGATGGSSGSAATGGSGGSNAGGSSGSNGDDLFTVNVSVSTKIPTVGIATWSITKPIDSAYIEFGRDQNAFEYKAPVDLSVTDYRTLLLGMKAAKQYYARITASGSGQTYVSKTYPLMTGYLPNGLPTFTVTDHDASALYAGGGFTVNCTGLTTGGIGGPTPTGPAPGGTGGATQSYAFIFDKDGEQVWAYELTDTPVAGCSRARMSLDGKYLWAANFNNASTMGAVMRVSMDGLDDPKNIAIRARNHDLAFLPNGHLLYWEQQNGGGYTNGKEGPDTIREMDPDTMTVTDVYDEMRDFADQINASQGSHTNQVNYIPELQAISFSMRHTSTIGLISYPGSELLAVFGGPITTFSNMDWTIQHGHDVHKDHLWVFNNQATNGSSAVLGFTYDVTSKTATPTLDYNSGVTSGAFGDVKEQPNGNLYVTYSTAGVFHEITQTGTLLREVKTTASCGYSEHRATLYGPPPPYATE
jgi:hypothetical protein